MPASEKPTQKATSLRIARRTARFPLDLKCNIWLCCAQFDLCVSMESWRSTMRVFWIGVGTLTALTLVVFPYIASERCKDRWARFNLEGIWDYKTGCSVKIGGSLVREENVSFDPRKPAIPPSNDSAKTLDPHAPSQTLTRPDWVILGPGDVGAWKSGR